MVVSKNLTGLKDLSGLLRGVNGYARMDLEIESPTEF